MDQKQVDLILFVAADNKNHISKDFILALDLNPENKEIICLLDEHGIVLEEDLGLDFEKTRKLTREQEYVLVIKAKSGDTNALYTLMEAFYEFVQKLAEKCLYKSSVLYNASYDVNDLTQEGVLDGVSQAVKKFDVYKKWRFSTYVTQWVHAAFNNIIYGSNLLKMPKNRKKDILRLQKAYWDYCHDHDEPPTIEILSEMINVPISVTKKLYGYLNCIETQSLNEVFNPYLSGSDDIQTLDAFNISGKSMCDYEHPTEFNSSVEEYLFYNKRYEELYRAINSLTDEEKEIIYLRYGFGGEEPWTLDKLAEKYCMSIHKIRKKIAGIVVNVGNNLNDDMITP